MRNHYEGTALDTTGKLFSDVGAGAFSYPNRLSPVTWTTPSYPGNKYFNERTIAQPPTGWNIVCQSRPGVPRQMAALMWYGIDDSSTSVHFPVYGSVTRIAPGWAGKGPQDGVTPPMMEFSLDSAFYVFNLVSNFAYSRWDAIYADVYSEIIAKENTYFALVEEMDAKVVDVIQSGRVDEAIEMMTSFSENLGQELLKDWFTFFGKLFVKFRDGYVTTPAPHVPVCGCETNSLPYQQQWYDRIVEDTGDFYKVPKGREHDRPAIPKSQLRALL